MTIGADFAVKRLEIDKRNIILHIWDLSGQINFKSIRELYYDNTSGIILVYDMTNERTLKNIPGWLEEYKLNGNKYPIPVAVVGNKSDLVDSNIVENIFTNQTKILYDSINPGVIFHPTSAKSGENIEQLFMDLARRLVDWI